MESWASLPSRCSRLLFSIHRAHLPDSGGSGSLRFFTRLLSSLPCPSSPFDPIMRPCLRRFSSFTSSCSSNRLHTATYFVHNTVDGGNNDRLEPLLHRATVIRPPPTISVKQVPRNSCSFIGSVVFDPRTCSFPTRRHHNFGVYTVLQVDSATHHSFPASERLARTPNDQSLQLRILLLLYGDLAKSATEYLRRGDFIYVCGNLASYKKPDEGGNRYINHKLYVKDLNFVARNIGSRTMKNLDEDDNMIRCYGERKSGNDRDGEHREHIHLWQVFFANPTEWWDNRHCKRYPGQPDFRNKDTNECLTLRSDDPPWVRKQLEKYDVRKMDRDDIHCSKMSATLGFF